MASWHDLLVSAAINGGTMLCFLFAFAFLRLQPFSDRVYYPKWYSKGVRRSVEHQHRHLHLQPQHKRNGCLNLNLRSYLHVLDWMREALKMPQSELIDHAGLDSAVYLRIYLLGLKLFIPIMAVGFLVLVPLNATDTNLLMVSKSKEFFSANIDRLSIANVQAGSNRLWAHLLLTYVFTFWTFFLLFHEYKTVAALRFQFLMSQQIRPDQFTVLVRQIPKDLDEPIDLHIKHFFLANHSEYYLLHQIVYNANELAKIVKKRQDIDNRLDYIALQLSKGSPRPTLRKGFLGLRGETVDAIDFYKSELERLAKEAKVERDKIRDDEKAKLPTAFVSFSTRWGAAVCAQSRQTKDPTVWLTEWAPEPRDVYWRNLAIPYTELYVRKVVVTAAVVVLVFFFIIPVAFVQTLANIESIERTFKFLRPVIKRKTVKSVLQGFLPGLAMKLFLLVLPGILMIMSKLEGHLSLSKLDRVSAAKQHYFMVINVFGASVLTGTALEQLNIFLHQAPTDIPKTLGDTIPLKVTFFISYIMVGWASVAGEILRLQPLIFYHFKNLMFVKTERDRERAMAPGSACFNTAFPQLELYFLLGIVYSVIAPIILPFVVIFFGFAYLVYRHQVINVYQPEYESAAAFWPHIHNRIVSSMVIQQLTLLGLFSTKQAAKSTPLLLLLPVVTLVFFLYTKRRFEPAFLQYPLEEARAKDMIDKAKHSYTDIARLVEVAYVHPVLRLEDEENAAAVAATGWQEREPALVPTNYGAKRLEKTEVSLR